MIQVRAQARDYVDMGALITLGKVSLPTALVAAAKIYGPSFNPQITLKALSYFDDGNLRDLPEAMKLRLLNASHSAFAYLGFLAGHEYIYQVAAQPAFETLMRRFMNEEVTPTLAIPSEIDAVAYRDALVRRFANPALPHRTQQIAMDGSQKLPQRLLATARDNLAAGRPMPFFLSLRRCSTIIPMRPPTLRAKDGRCTSSSQALTSIWTSSPRSPRMDWTVH